MSYELIETVEVGSGGASSIEFTSIPQDGTDLVLVCSLRTDLSGSVENSKITFNGTDDGSAIRLNGNGSGTGSDSLTKIQVAAAGNTLTSNTFSSNQVYISNYTSTSDKSVSVETVVENNATFSRQAILAGKTDTISTGITSIALNGYSGNLLQYSSASLYKITAA